MRKLPLLALIATVAASGAIWWWVRAPIDIPDDDLPQPTGFWRRGAPLEGDPEELARLLSLPYAAGTQVATIPGLGVVEYDRERASDGLNLYVSGHDSEALLIDMEGVLKHRWAIQFIDAVPESDKATEHSYMRRVQLTPDGDLIVMWHEQGLARVDLRSRLEWSRDLGVYNDLYYSSEGGEETLIVIHKLAEQRPSLASETQSVDQLVLNDQLLWLDAATGETLRSLSLLDALERSRWASALERRPDQPDILHTNAVTVLDESMVEGSPFEPGWVLFSLREISLIGVLDPETEEIVWALQGPPFEMQHEPVLLPGATFLLFDNAGPGGRASRVLEVSLEGEVLWSWPKDGAEGDHGLFSPHMGTVRRLSNGNTLIVESEGGTVIEVTPEGEVVWRFETPHRSGEQGRLIAVMPEMVRIAVPEWMTAESDGG